ncbi:DUF4118 domain-containing protein [Brevibacterium sp. 5221]|uniref:histidine kinase n=1 Tax=Brevibacterium rongguiense TaxID=2695267 RepID=A0A6N9H979_9MICO|nr:DUF4118 domain-containing protein [Brevibacterium rongguiense]MYM20589.1 DUF4118 domain-containing protein [Brevibacterium rongguiense]
MARGTLKIYLGAAPGVGKTYAMLEEAHALIQQGTRVLAGVIETHGRPDTARLLEGIPVQPPLRIDHRGHAVDELDVDGIIAAAPETVLVDELAHTKAGEAGGKRFADVERLLAAGLDVISTVNIQHLESLADVVAGITGQVQRETIPDRVLREADQVELVDLSPEALRIRLSRGQVYRPERIDAALSHYFRLGNLTALRELALLWTADQVDAGLEAYRRRERIADPWPARERILVAVTAGDESAALIRRGSRIAGRAAGRELLVVTVIAQDGLAQPTPEDLSRLQSLTESLGGTWHAIAGEDPAAALADFAHTANAAQLVIGTSRRRFPATLLGPGVSARLIQAVGDIDIHIVPHRATPRVRPRPARRSALSRPRLAAGWALAAVLPPLLTAAFLGLGRDTGGGLLVNILAYIAAAVAVALVGGWWPALVGSLAGALLLNWFFTPPVGTLTIAAGENIIALLLFLLVAAGVARVVDTAARRAREAAEAREQSLLMSELAGSVVREGTNIPALLEHIAHTYGQSAAVLQARAGGGWETVFASAGADGANDADGSGEGASGSGEGAEQALTLDADYRLLISGRPLTAAEQQSLDAYSGRILALARQRELQDARLEGQRLAAANAARTALLTAVSHDLRTPLTAIKTSASALRMDDVELPADAQAELLAAIEDSADRLDRIVADLLHMSRLQTGALEVRALPCAVDELVATAVGGMEPAAVPAALRTDIPGGLPLVRTDPGLFERVLANLVHNAARHAGPDVLIDAAAGAGHVTVRVVDHGPGLSDAAKEQMFTPFHRLGDQEDADGVGLGAAVAKGLCEAIGAQLWAEDTPGGGLTVAVDVPLASAPEPAAAREPASAQYTAGARP